MEKHNIIEGAKLKFLIAYDSNFGNTEKVAGAIGEAVTPLGEVKVLRVSKAKLLYLAFSKEVNCVV